ncbi:MAG: SBBP repeat-containing protein [Betaproteobacteria bacterium]|nr:SBBP repeat-containing protein [Betaproteobacteria bacterium]
MVKLGDSPFSCENDHSVSFPLAMNFPKILFCGLFCCVAAINVDAQIPIQQWRTSFNGGSGEATFVGDGDRDIAKRAFVLDVAGNAYLAGSIVKADSTHDMLVVKVDASGQELWRAVISGDTGSDNLAKALAATPDGVVITGSSSGAARHDFLTVKLDASGAELWRAIYSATSTSIDVPRDVAVDTAGNVYVLGVSTETSGYALVKYDASGNELWRPTVGPATVLQGKALALDGDANPIVTGFYTIAWPINSTNTYFATRTVKYAADGNVLWERTLTEAPPVSVSHGFSPKAIAVDSANSSYVAGRCSPDLSPAGGFCVVKYNSSGDKQWEMVSPGTGGDPGAAQDIRVDGSGNIHATGYRTFAANPEMFTVLLDTNGQAIWQATLPGVAGGAYGYALALDSAANTYVAGSRYNGSNFDVLLARYSASETPDWQGAIRGPAELDDQGRAVAVDNSGNLRIAGNIRESTSAPLGTMFVSRYGRMWLDSVVSRKTVGGDNWDIPIDPGQPLDGPVTTEPRVANPGHLLIFRFSEPITSVGGATASVGTSSASFSGNSVSVDLAGVPDQNRVAVGLSGVNADYAVSAPIGFLIGDVTNSRAVSAADIAAIKARTGQVVNAANLRFDTNLSGAISAMDVISVRVRSGQVLP